MIKQIERWWRHRSGDTRQRLTQLCATVSDIVFIVLTAVWVYLARQEWVKDEPDTIVLNMIVLAFVAQLLLASLVLSRLEGLPWFWKWFGSLNTEFAGALILSALLLFLVTIPNQRRETNEMKRGLMREMRSSDNGIALLAVEELAERGWLFDGTLQGAGLAGANLQGADLAEADLRGATLVEANLQGADLANANLQRAFLIWANLRQATLVGANLQRATLEYATLQQADLVNADLQGVFLRGTNMQGADLAGADLRKSFLWNADLQQAYLGGANLQETNMSGANLRGVNLWNANLQGANLAMVGLQEAYLYNADLRGANLEDATFDETTRLPDDTYWTPDTDMARFTDPNHPEFWRSDDPSSPAYRGEGE